MPASKKPEPASSPPRNPDARREVKATRLSARETEALDRAVAKAGGTASTWIADATRDALIAAGYLDPTPVPNPRPRSRPGAKEPAPCRHRSTKFTGLLRICNDCGAVLR